METWQVIISICAGAITIMTFFEKLGIPKSLKKVDNDLTEFKKMPSQMTSVMHDVATMNSLQRIQNTALLAILRNALYQCFKDNRDIAAWTDDEASVQTKLHEVYKALHGNGEEDIWWEKKKTWKIVSCEEYKELISTQNKIA